ncbi:HPP family protein [Candidatus Omnitrophota bacterium]
MRTVKDVMTRRVITIPADMGIQQVCKILIKNNLSGIPVVDCNNKLIGFVSERDIVATIAQGDLSQQEAKHIMTKRPKTVKEDSPLSLVTKLFTNNFFRHIPVVKRGEVVGIVSRHDTIGRLLSR